MDDLAGPSFFDYPTTSHSTMPSNLEIPGSGLDAVMKHEAFDSTAWIQGCSDLSGGLDHGFSVSYQHPQSIKHEFGTSSLESLMSSNPASVSSQAQIFDPLEMILNQPAATSSNNVRNTTGMLVNGTEINQPVTTAVPSSSFNITTMQQNTISHTSTLIKVEANNSPNLETLSNQNPAEVIPPTVQDADSTPAEIKAEEVVKKEVDPKNDLNLYLTNVVTSFRVRCHLNLRRIAQEGINVIYQKESKKIVMRIRNPSCTAYIWSSGKIVCTGASSEINAKKAARKCAKRLQTMGFRVGFSSFKVINVLAVCKMPYHINIVEFSNVHRSKYLSYEPELHPAVTYRIPEWKVTFKIFSTGSVTLTCPVIPRIPEAVKRIYPLVVDFFKYDKPNDLLALKRISEDKDENEEDCS